MKKKLFYENNNQVIQEDEKLIESRLKESIEAAISKFPNCKVVNLSLSECPIHNRSSL